MDLVHTEVTNYSSLSCFSVNEVIGRDMSHIQFPKGQGREQADSSLVP